ncbi:hypothetical protein AB0K60_35420 [Thermopolyspora sp. NPDC052614]|uniref:hypothetical protein n=1 Tax=Thermopolyspora sp. NPDC052614 TaxID=3155682 RepID=UPI003440E111
MIHIELDEHRNHVRLRDSATIAHLGHVKVAMPEWNAFLDDIRRGAFTPQTRGEVAAVYLEGKVHSAPIFGRGSVVITTVHAWDRFVAQVESGRHRFQGPKTTLIGMEIPAQA